MYLDSEWESGFDQLDTARFQRVTEKTSRNTESDISYILPA